MTNEEQGERYVLDILPAAVWLYDTKDRVTVKGFYGPARLLAATAELNRLNAAEEGGEWHRQDSGTWKPFTPYTPAEFLAETLPAKARRQRLEAHLREVREHEGHLARVLAADAANLKRAITLREKLEKELASPLSSTLPAQNADLVGQDTPEPFSFLERLQAPQRAQSKPVPGAAGNAMFKPGPF